MLLSHICHPEVRKPPLWGWAGSWGPAWQGRKHSPQAPTGRLPRGPDTPGARCPKETPQAMGFACFNDGLGEMWVELPEIHKLRRPLAPHAHADVRAAGDTNWSLLGCQPGSTVCTPPSSQHQGFLRAATADTGNET